MKKKKWKALFGGLVLIMGLILTACGGKKEAAESEQTKEEEQTVQVVEEADTKEYTDEEKETLAKAEEKIAEEIEQTETDAAEEETEKEYATVEEYCKEPETKEMLDEIAHSAETDELSLELRAEGNKIIYVVTIKEIGPDQVTEEMVHSLDEELDARAETYEYIAETLRDEVGIDSVTVCVDYRDSDGNSLVYKEYPVK